jgi:hypothetical protein
MSKRTLKKRPTNVASATLAVAPRSAILWANADGTVETYQTRADAKGNNPELPAYRVAVIPLSRCSVIERAVDMLIDEAQCLRDSHTIKGEWDAEEAAARASYDDFMRTAAKLRALLPNIRHESDGGKAAPKAL